MPGGMPERTSHKVFFWSAAMSERIFQVVCPRPRMSTNLTLYTERDTNSMRVPTRTDESEMKGVPSIPACVSGGEHALLKSGLVVV